MMGKTRHLNRWESLRWMKKKKQKKKREKCMRGPKEDLDEGTEE